ncbi:MAG: XRE family transcriptional regulator [Xanthobacteraceae bacterium]|nr:XRE family transcriptional regulator [Xanthobacteraceae bacterium]
MKKASTPRNKVETFGANAGMGRIGLEVRVLRRRRKMTIEQVSAATGLNRGYLSRLERGEKAPSIASVVKLAQALDVPVSTLFGESLDDSLIHVVKASTHSAVNTKLSDDEYVFVPLSRSGKTGLIESFIMYPPPQFGNDGLVAHAGDEAFFVLSGKVQVRFNGRDVDLDAGDFLEFPGNLPHQVRRLGRPKAAVLITISRN